MKSYLEVINVSHLFMGKRNLGLVPTNVDWSRLNLEPVAVPKLKTMLRSRAIRVAFYTGSELRLTVLTRHPSIGGRRARRTSKGFWETYEIGRGWVCIDNQCEVWLMP